MIFAFTPFLIALWTRQASRGLEPSTITKMSLGCFGVALSYCIMAAAALAGRRRQGKLAVAVRLFRRRHPWRALFVAGRPFAGDQGGSGEDPIDDDGGVAGDEFCRRLPRRMARQLLEPDGEAGIFLMVAAIAALAGATIFACRWPLRGMLNE